jgi:hypothetical protein
MMGNSTFWNIANGTEKHGGNDGNRTLINNSSNTASIQYVSRSIHNYHPTTYDGTWTEKSGEADSSTALGAAGYGQFEYYADIWEPFDTV